MLGRRLRQLRLERGLSQTDLAGDELSPSAVSLLESGRREPTTRTLEKLAEQLGCTVEYLRDGRQPPTAGLSFLRLHRAELAARTGQGERAAQILNEMLTGDQPNHERWQHTRYVQALTAEAAGQTSTAIEILEELAAAAGKNGSLPVDVALCRCYRTERRFDSSVRVASRALAWAEKLGLQHLPEYSELTTTLVLNLLDLAQHDQAMKIAQRVLAGKQPLSCHEAIVAYANASQTAEDHGRLAEAARLAERALAAWQTAYELRGVAKLHTLIASLLLQADDPDVTAVLQLLVGSQKTLAQSGPSEELAACEIQLARTAMHAADLKQACAWAEQAVATATKADAQLELCRAFILLGECAIASGDTEGAHRYGERAAEQLRQLPIQRSIAPIWQKLGELLQQMGASTAALEAYHHALSSAGIGGPSF